jgi:hypothetical protein
LVPFFGATKSARAQTDFLAFSIALIEQQYGRGFGAQTFGAK